MKLELVREEGEVYLSEEERERRRKRAKWISPWRVRAFIVSEQKEIKEFLSSLVMFTEQIHHEFEFAEEHETVSREEVERLQTLRNDLFVDPTDAVAKFIELLDFFPMEPWHEFELMIAGLRGDNAKRYFETRLKAPVGTMVLQLESELELKQGEQILLEMKCRITPDEINRLIYSSSLEDLVHHLIMSRRLITGEFWSDGYYDL